MTKEIMASGVRYMSDIPEFAKGLPHGILNKSVTDAGGTFAALKCKDNYIIVTPTIDLVDSILADKNVKYEMFGVYSGVLYMEFKDYILRNKTHKIIVTYDSFPKVKYWLDKNGFDSTGYKLLVDEYHLLLEEMGFRDKAINNLMREIAKFKHYTFMSATPTKETFLDDFMAALPYTKVVWDENKKIIPTRIQTPDPFKTTTLLINEFMKGYSLTAGGKMVKVKELYIFLNSVTGIKQIIDTAGLTNSDVKVVCHKSIKNEAVLEDIQISKVTEPNAKINFFTKKGFQGCNLFSNNGLIVVVSDAQRSHTLVDIGTTIHQIAGRLRTNSEYDNVLKNYIWHIFSTLTLVKSDEEFVEMMDRIKKHSNAVSNEYNNFDKISRDAFRNIINVDALVCYLDTDTDRFVYSKRKELYLTYKHELINDTYKNGISVKDAYNGAGFNHTEEAGCKGSEDIILKRISTVGFRSLLIQYMTLKKENANFEAIGRYEQEFPLFRDAWDILGESGIKTCKYVESTIKDAVRGKSDDTLRSVYYQFHKKVGNSNFISNREAKALLQKIFRNLNILKFKPVVTMLKDCKWLEVKPTKKWIDCRQVEGITIRQIGIITEVMYSTGNG